MWSETLRKNEEANRILEEKNKDDVIELLFQKIDIYKQTLTEIKESIKNLYNTPLSDKNCMDCDDCFYEIMKKISDVE